MSTYYKKELLYSGKAKSLYKTEDHNYLIVEFRDDITALDGVKREKLSNKGNTNNKISAFIMKVLKKANLPTHFVKMLSPNEVLVRQLKMIPLESVIRNIAAGSICRRLGVTAGTKFSPSLYELFLKNDELHDPLVNENHVVNFHWATSEQLKEMESLTHQVNQVVTQLFAKSGLLLVDAKYEFGISLLDGKIYLGDEISPDSCRIWHKETGKPLDKDRFRKDLGNVVESYECISELLGIH